jgi:signal transduction histidine kinase
MLANESSRRILPQKIPVNSDQRFLDVIKDCPQVEAVVKTAIREGIFTKETEQRLGPSEEALTVRISTLPLKNRQGKESGTLVLISDVTDEVALQRQMKDAERLSTMGTLAAALAHEIRNPLEALNLNLELLERIMQHIRVDSEVSRLAGVVENFLSFARPGNSASSSIRLDSLLHQVVELIENQAKSRGVTVDIDMDGEPIIVRGFEDRLKQLFLNLVINGIDAMPEGGDLSLQAEIVGRTDSKQPATLAVVSVRDTGEGIPHERLHRLFEPFYSTRIQGTGLGLTIAARIAKEHGGVIRIESIPGEGSKFTVELPVSA